MEECSMKARRLVTLAAMLVSTPALAIDISTCDQVVPRGQVGVLIADLDCRTTAVRLEMGARLRLDGHTIAVDSGLGVECRQKRCTIEGPGVIDGKTTADTGIGGHERVRLDVSDVTIQNFEFGIFGVARNKANLENVVVDGNALFGLDLQQPSTINASNLTVRNTNGPTGRAVHAENCVGEDWTITDNLATLNEQSGVACARARIDRLTATGNGGTGVWLGVIGRFRDSTITGNGVGGDGIDIVSERRPRLIATTCGRSADKSGTPWGVCTND
jgi:hypothetical protein